MSGRLLRLAVIAALVGLAAGCGGSRRASPPPRLPRALASQLAASSDSVAATFARGDRCDASVRAAALNRAVHGAVRAGRVPRPLRSSLVRAADSLAAALPPCPPPPPAGAQEPTPRSHDHGKHKGEHKHEGGE